MPRRAVRYRRASRHPSEHGANIATERSRPLWPGRPGHGRQRYRTRWTKFTLAVSRARRKPPSRSVIPPGSALVWHGAPGAAWPDTREGGAGLPARSRPVIVAQPRIPFCPRHRPPACLVEVDVGGGIDPVPPHCSMCYSAPKPFSRAYQAARHEPVGPSGARTACERCSSYLRVCTGCHTTGLWG